MRQYFFTFRYIFFPILAHFFLSFFIFWFFFIIFKCLWITNHLFNFDLSFRDLVQSFYFSSINALPILIPVCVFFTLFFTYNHLSHNFEILALRSIGFNLKQIAFPALLFGFLIFLCSIPVSFYLAPWGHKKLELLVDKFRVEKKKLKIRANVFVENVFNFVIYANDVDEKNGNLKKVFFYEDVQSPWPLTIIAQSAKLLNSKDKHYFLRLLNGSIHRTTKTTHTKVNFSSYDVYFPFNKKRRIHFHPSSYNIEEIKSELNKSENTFMTKKKKSEKRRRRLQIAYYYFFNYPIAVLIFTLLGFSLGTFYIRQVKINGFVLCAILLATYWTLHSNFLSMGKYGTLSPLLAASLTNILFLVPVYFGIKRINF